MLWLNHCMQRDSSNAYRLQARRNGSNPAEQTEKAYHQLFKFCMHICILYETAAVTMSEIYAVHIHYNNIIYIFYHFV